MRKALVVASMLLALSTPHFAQQPPLSELQARLEDRVQEWLAAGEWARPMDGYVYAIDLGQLLTYAALRGNERLYDTIRDAVVRDFIRDDPSDPYTRGFVLWRFQKDTLPDASGTAEALQIAKGLWRGSQAFGRMEDRALALLVLRGYARHAYLDQGVWLIRNYFNLGARAFASNSFLVNFDVDLVDEVAAASADDELKEVAANGYDLVRRAVTPAGLLHEMIQPEILTLLPDLDIAIFSPNRVVHLANTCTVAERAALRDREIGARVLRFASERAADLRIYYDAASGEPASDHSAGPATYACLVRLAGALGDASREIFLERLAAQAAAFLEEPYELRLYNAGEFLLTLNAIGGRYLRRNDHHFLLHKSS
jgi:hypothetical protein